MVLAALPVAERIEPVVCAPIRRWRQALASASALWRWPKLAIALWRYLEEGLIPQGTNFEPIGG